MMEFTDVRNTYFLLTELSPINTICFISIVRPHNLLFHFITKNITESMQAVSSPEIFALVQSGSLSCVQSLEFHLTLKKCSIQSWELLVSINTASKKLKRYLMMRLSIEFKSCHFHVCHYISFVRRMDFWFMSSSVGLLPKIRSPWRKSYRLRRFGALPEVSSFNKYLRHSRVLQVMSITVFLVSFRRTKAGYFLPLKAILLLPNKAFSKKNCLGYTRKVHPPFLPL